MTVSDLLLPSRDRPARGPVRAAILLLGLIDAALLILLPHAAWVVAVIAVGVLGLAIAGRLHWGIALIAVGTPLLDPISVVIQTEAPVFFALRISLALAIGWFFFAGTRRPGQSAGRIVGEPVVLWALALGFVVAAGLWGSPSPAYGRMKVVAYASTCIPLLLGGYLLAAPRAGDDEESRGHRFDLLCRAVVILSLLVALAGLLNLAFQFEPYDTRLKVLGLNPIWLARIMGLGILALLGLWDSRGAGPGRPVLGTLPAVLLALPLGAVMVFAGSRGPLLGLGVVLAIRGVVLTRASLARRTARFFAGLAAAGLLLLLMPAEVRDRFLNPVHQDISGIVRLRLIEVAREALSNVRGWGAGTGAFSDLMKMGDHRFYPHNLFAEIGIENGFLGLLVLAGFLIAPAARGLRQWRDARTLTALLIFLFAAWNAQVSGDLTSNEWIWLSAGLIAGRTR
jgi:hypothetical protein